MKRTVLLLAAVLILVGAGSALAQEGRSTGIDVFGGFATETIDDVGAGYGLGVGVTVPFNTLFQMSNMSGTEDLAIRADLSYFHWEDEVNVFGTNFDVEATRIPLFVGARYYLPSHVISGPIDIFGELGLQLSFDEFEVATFFGTVSDDQVNFGVPIGAGIEFNISDAAYLGLSGRLHIIDETYFTMVGVLGLNLM